MKAALEALKRREPRLPLPKGADAPAGFNDGRMRAYYLPDTWLTGGLAGSGGEFRPKLDAALIDSTFWVVSRGNNCHYCLGHQELKLRGAGLDDDAIAALDSNWSLFNPRQHAALAYARKLTVEPYSVDERDIANLKALFTDAEIVELTFNIARFNAMNRWAMALGLPQERQPGETISRFDTPTSHRFKTAVSLVAPPKRAARPPLPTLDETRAALAACRERSARVEFLTEEDARKALSAAIGNRSPLFWERAFAQFAGVGAQSVAIFNTMASDENLPARLKAELALISAVHNRAWYAVGHAVHRLRALGATTEETVALFTDESAEANDATAAHRLAAKLTADPHLITDADIARVRKQFSDRKTAQIVHVICMANWFDRFTEALGLPLENGICE